MIATVLDLPFCSWNIGISDVVDLENEISFVLTSVGFCGTGTGLVGIRGGTLSECRDSVSCKLCIDSLLGRRGSDSFDICKGTVFGFRGNALLELSVSMLLGFTCCNEALGLGGDIG